MKITPRQIQIKNWLNFRKTPFQPFHSLDFLKHPFNLSFHKSMELEAKKIADIEEYLPPPVRSFDNEDVQSVKIFKTNLPHWSLATSTYFVTFCISNRKKKSLSLPVAATIVEDAINFYSGKQYEIDSYVIMPDHVHLLITPYPDFELSKILFNMKSFATKTINNIFSINGRFWQPDNFDHLVRNHGYWIRYFDYIHNNPVKACIVKTPDEYTWSSLSKLYSAR
ncbi:MAG: transposase [Parachlamydiaceae bacterium]|nr:transposase [Parachlamydiaceae bacterium]